MPVPRRPKISWWSTDDSTVNTEPKSTKVRWRTSSSCRSARLAIRKNARFVGFIAVSKRANVGRNFNVAVRKARRTSSEEAAHRARASTSSSACSMSRPCAERDPTRRPPSPSWSTSDPSIACLRQTRPSFQLPWSPHVLVEPSISGQNNRMNNAGKFQGSVTAWKGCVGDKIVQRPQKRARSLAKKMVVSRTPIILMPNAC